MVLTLLAILIAALVVLAAGRRHLSAHRGDGRRRGHLCPGGRAGGGGAGSGAGAATLAVPIGPPGASMHLALDPLAASFLLLLFLVMPCAETAPLPLAAAALTVLAAMASRWPLGLLLLGGVTLAARHGRCARSA